jgi:hypothetical protein
MGDGSFDVEEKTCNFDRDISAFFTAVQEISRYLPSWIDVRNLALPIPQKVKNRSKAA